MRETVTTDMQRYIDRQGGERQRVGGKGERERERERERGGGRDGIYLV